MSNNNIRRLTSALVAAAAIGSLAIGSMGAASADPGTVKTARFTVINKSKGPIKFKTIIPGTDAPIQGPPHDVTIVQGKSVWFDVKVFPKSAQNVTSAYFETPKGDHYWGVDMKANDSSTQAECTTNSSCSPKNWAQTNTITMS